jgi:class 3 adenylate cyclase
VLYGTAARFTCDPPTHPWGFTQAQIELQEQEIDEHWGEGALTELFMGSIADVAGVREVFGRAQRTGASPTMATLLWKALMEIDVRDVLASVDAPTLVLHRPGDRVAPVEAAELLAAGLPNAVFRALPPGDHMPHEIMEPLVAEILGFVVGESRRAPSTERMLATVLFTDIVGSTESVTAQGDERWRRRLDAHDEIVDRHLAASGGHKVKDTGDGMFATFDGPTKAARCALDLVPDLATRGIRIRAGIHIGECERRGDDWSGLAVHVGARVAAQAGAGEVLVTRTVRDLSAGSGLGFEDRGSHELKGVPYEWQLFRVTAGDSARA